MSMFKPLRSLLLAFLSFGLFLPCYAVGQTITSITPSSVTAGSDGFLLTVYGNGFNSDSVVQLQSSSGTKVLQTYFVRSEEHTSELQSQ